MTEQAQVGDTVRLTIAIEGEVYAAPDGGLIVHGWRLNMPNHTVEILSRAIPPLPTEPGTFWLDRQNDMWRVDLHGDLYCVGMPEAVAATFAPFRQLVLK